MFLKLYFAPLLFLAFTLSGCRTPEPAAGLLVEYKPTIAIMGGTAPFSTKPEVFKIGVAYTVGRGYVDRVDVEVDGRPAGSHYIVQRVLKGKFRFDVDASALTAGEHELRITAFQGKRFAREIYSTTKTLKFYVIR